LLLAAYALRLVGTPWVFADAVLAALLVAAPFAAALLPDDYAATRAGIRHSSATLCALLALPALELALNATPSEAYRVVPVAVALASAFAANAWVAGDGIRVALFAAAGLFVQAAALLVVETLEFRLDVHERYASFLLAPAAYAFLAGWLAARR